MKKICEGIVVAVFFLSSGSIFAGVVKISDREFYTAQLMACHFPIPANYEYYSFDDNSLLFVEDVSSATEEQLKIDGVYSGKIEFIKNYPVPETTQNIDIVSLIKSEDLELLKASAGKFFIYIVQKGLDRVSIVDKKLSDDQVISIAQYCYDHPVQ